MAKTLLLLLALAAAVAPGALGATANGGGRGTLDGTTPFFFPLPTEHVLVGRISIR